MSDNNIYDERLPRGRLLSIGDTVLFIFDKYYIKYTVSNNFLYNDNIENDEIFNVLGLDPYKFCSKHYGYIPIDGIWPQYKECDMHAATIVVNALYAIIKKRNKIVVNTLYDIIKKRNKGELLQTDSYINSLEQGTMILYGQYKLSDCITSKQYESLTSKLKDDRPPAYILERAGIYKYDIAKRMKKSIPNSSMGLYYYYDTEGTSTNTQTVYVCFSNDIEISIEVDTNLNEDTLPFLISNIKAIEEKIDKLVQQNINLLFSSIDSSMDSFISNVSIYNLPYTKDMIMSKTLELFKDKSIKVADNFKDSGYKRSLLSIFK